ncbi:hypothetical protein ACF2G4_08905 [Pantoea sp. C3]|uniref:hypothetical protein n=1 Tax=Pantoea phytostimulans TaxID=2769024 RepID=UPI0038F60347
MKIVKMVACLGALLLLSGCTVVLWGGNKVADKRTEKHVQVQDNVDGVFQYKNLAASVLQGESKITLDIPPEGIAFLGEKNIYILTRGATELMSLDKISTLVALVSGFEKYDGVRLKLTSSGKDDAVMHFSDTLVVWVDKSYGRISDYELNIIKSAGFWNNGGRYVKQVHIEGVIIPRGKNNNIFSKTDFLDKKHKVQFYSEDNSTNFHPLNLATNVVLTPFTAVADIIFFPISLRLLGLISNPSVH